MFGPAKAGTTAAALIQAFADEVTKLLSHEQADNRSTKAAAG
jgi:hypothetical protein